MFPLRSDMFVSLVKPIEGGKKIEVLVKAKLEFDVDVSYETERLVDLNDFSKCRVTLDPVSQFKSNSFPENPANSENPEKSKSQKQKDLAFKYIPRPLQYTIQPLFETFVGFRSEMQECDTFLRDIFDMPLQIVRNHLRIESNCEFKFDSFSETSSN